MSGSSSVKDHDVHGVNEMDDRGAVEGHMGDTSSSADCTSGMSALPPMADDSPLENTSEFPKDDLTFVAPVDQCTSNMTSKDKSVAVIPDTMDCNGSQQCQNCSSCSCAMASLDCSSHFNAELEKPSITCNSSSDSVTYDENTFLPSLHLNLSSRTQFLNPGSSQMLYHWEPKEHNRIVREKNSRRYDAAECCADDSGNEDDIDTADCSDNDSSQCDVDTGRNVNQIDDMHAEQAVLSSMSSVAAGHMRFDNSKTSVVTCESGNNSDAEAWQRPECEEFCREFRESIRRIQDRNTRQYDENHPVIDSGDTDTEDNVECLTPGAEFRHSVSMPIGHMINLCPNNVPLSAFARENDDRSLFGHRESLIQPAGVAHRLLSEFADEPGCRFRHSELLESDFRFAPMTATHAADSYHQSEGQYRRSPEQNSLSCDSGARNTRSTNAADDGSCFSRNRRKNFPDGLDSAGNSPKDDDDDSDDDLTTRAGLLLCKDSKKSCGIKGDSTFKFDRGKDRVLPRSDGSSRACGTEDTGNFASGFSHGSVSGCASRSSPHYDLLRNESNDSDARNVILDPKAIGFQKDEQRLKLMKKRREKKRERAAAAGLLQSNAVEGYLGDKELSIDELVNYIDSQPNEPDKKDKKPGGGRKSKKNKKNPTEKLESCDVGRGRKTPASCNLDANSMMGSEMQILAGNSMSTLSNELGCVNDSNKSSRFSSENADNFNAPSAKKQVSGKVSAVNSFGSKPVTPNIDCVSECSAISTDECPAGQRIVAVKSSIEKSESVADEERDMFSELVSVKRDINSDGLESAITRECENTSQTDADMEGKRSNSSAVIADVKGMESKLLPAKQREVTEKGYNSLTCVLPSVEELTLNRRLLMDADGSSGLYVTGSMTPASSVSDARESLDIDLYSLADEPCVIVDSDAGNPCPPDDGNFTVVKQKKKRRTVQRDFSGAQVNLDYKSSLQLENSSRCDFQSLKTVGKRPQVASRLNSQWNTSTTGLKASVTAASVAKTLDTACERGTVKPGLKAVECHAATVLPDKVNAISAGTMQTMEAQTGSPACITEAGRYDDVKGTNVARADLNSMPQRVPMKQVSRRPLTQNICNTGTDKHTELKQDHDVKAQDHCVQPLPENCIAVKGLPSQCLQQNPTGDFRGVTDRNVSSGIFATATGGTSYDLSKDAGAYKVCGSSRKKATSATASSRSSVFLDTRQPVALTGGNQPQISFGFDSVVDESASHEVCTVPSISECCSELLESNSVGDLAMVKATASGGEQAALPAENQHIVLDICDSQGLTGDAKTLDSDGDRARQWSDNLPLDCRLLVSSDCSAAPAHDVKPAESVSHVSVLPSDDCGVTAVHSGLSARSSSAPAGTFSLYGAQQFLFSAYEATLSEKRADPNHVLHYGELMQQ